ncbi:cohesin domain-containing protein [Paenibacillus rigui]|uniref:Dockerin domain-containing protein n=1 Tax=Paenibacillus rigui TaxID=554312 RepID=A0A229UQ21_9BACL|nr:cohesin domain-containing protein [Paenibacillus rigui]OXM85522.1 hypothetical protein CF651_15200 [Paenibacillus rigui]
MLNMKGSLSVLMITAMCLGLLPAPVSAVTAEEVYVDYAVDTGVSNQVASGFLHGMTGEEPAQYLIDGIKVSAIRGADHHPNLPSLFDNATYKRAKATGAELMVGLYYYASQPNNTYWPGDNGNWTAWESVVESVYRESAAKGYKVYSWIPWNEPRLQWSGPDRTIDRYLEAHKVAYQKLKALNPTAKVQAPEDHQYNFEFMKTFLTYCKSQGCLPDILSWHELSAGALDVEAHTAEIKSWMLANGITPMPVAITEYQGCCTYNNINGWESGMAVSYIARLERSSLHGVQFGLKSAWDYSGDDPKFMAGMGDLADRNSGTLPKGVWWVYNGYKDMTGRLAKAETSNKHVLEVLASQDAAMNRSVILVGSENWREPSEMTLHLDHLDRVSYLIRNGKLHLKAEMITTADTLLAPYTMMEGDYVVTNGSLTVKLPPLLPKAAYRIYLTSGTAEAPVYSVEAEALKPQSTDGRVYRIFNESGADGGAAAVLESKSIGDVLSYTIPVPSAGLYGVKARVKSESSRGMFQLYVDGKAYGGPKDTYGPFDYYTVDFGNIPIQDSSAKLEFKVVGKNNYASDYFMVFDSFSLSKLADMESPLPQSIHLTNIPARLHVGDTVTSVVYATYSAAEIRQIHQGVTFGSSDRSIADIDDTGNVRAISPGQATLTAAFGALHTSFDVTVTTPEPSGPQAALTGTEAVTAGAQFTLGYRLNNGHNIYAQDLTFTYDPDQLDFISAEPARRGTVIADQTVKPGQARMLLANTGTASGDASGEQVILRWRVKQDAAAGLTTIALSKVVVADAAGYETPLAAVSHSVRVSVVDRTALLAIIHDAESKLGTAVVGTQPGQYPAGAIAALQTATQKAKATAERADVTSAEIQQAITDLAAAIHTFINSVIVLHGDLNGDGKYTIGDLAMAAACYGRTSADADWEQFSQADLNQDNQIDIADLAVIAAQLTMYP